MYSAFLFFFEEHILFRTSLPICLCETDAFLFTDAAYKLPSVDNSIFVLFNLSAELQLKSDHKPIEHLNDWKRKIVVMYTDKDPSHEDPNLVWRRDAIISIAEDKEVSLREMKYEIYFSWLQESKW